MYPYRGGRRLPDTSHYSAVIAWPHSPDPRAFHLLIHSFHFTDEPLWATDTPRGIHRDAMSQEPHLSITTDPQIREAIDILLQQYPCTYSYPAIRAFLMGERVAPAAIDPAMLFTIFWEEPPVFADAAAQTTFHAAFSALWQRLGEHTRKKAPFRLTRVNLPATGAELEAYLNIRGSEFTSLHAGFLQGRDAAQLDDDSTRLVTTLSACSFVIQRLWGEVYVAAEDDLLDKDVVQQIRRFESNTNKDVAAFVWKAARLQQAQRNG